MDEVTRAVETVKRAYNLGQISDNARRIAALEGRGDGFPAGKITAQGAIGDTAGLAVFTGADGVLETKTAAQALEALSIYPVGAIYESYGSVSPETLFGGVWEAMPGEVTRLTGTTSDAGTGGWKSYTVTYSVPFAAPPVFVVQPYAAFSNENIQITGMTDTDASFRVYMPTTGFTYKTVWQAYGRLAVNRGTIRRWRRTA